MNSTSPSSCLVTSPLVLVGGALWFSCCDYRSRRRFTFCRLVAISVLLNLACLNACADILTAQFWTLPIGATYNNTTVQSLKDAGVFTGTPFANRTLRSLQTALWIGNGPYNNYVARIQGYLVPPETGWYKIAFASDDHGEFHLSNNHLPGGLKLVGREPLNSNFQPFSPTRLAERSGIVWLVKGRQYCFEGYWIEFGGGDFLHVQWRGPDEKVSEITEAHLLALRTGGPLSVNMGAVNRTGQELREATLSPLAVTGGTLPLHCQWSKNGVIIDGAHSLNYFISSCKLSDSGNYSCTVTDTTGVEATGSTTLTIVPTTDTLGCIANLAGPTTFSVNCQLALNQDTVRKENCTIVGQSGVNVVSVAMGPTDNQFFVHTDTPIGPGASLTISNVKDASVAGNSVNPVPHHLEKPVKMETWYNSTFTGLGQDAINYMASTPPDSTTYLPEMYKGSSTFDDNVLRQFTALFVPATRGGYTFYVASDDQSKVFVSTDEDPANKVEVAAESQWNGDRDWKGTTRRQVGENVSPILTMQAGQKYYLKVMQRNAQGGDHVGITIEKVGDPPVLNFAQPSTAGGKWHPVAALGRLTFGEQPTVNRNPDDTWSIRASADGGVGAGLDVTLLRDGVPFDRTQTSYFSGDDGSALLTDFWAVRADAVGENYRLLDSAWSALTMPSDERPASKQVLLSYDSWAGSTEFNPEAQDDLTARGYSGNSAFTADVSSWGTGPLSLKLRGARLSQSSGRGNDWFSLLGPTESTFGPGGGAVILSRTIGGGGGLGGIFGDGTIKVTIGAHGVTGLRPDSIGDVLSNATTTEMLIESADRKTKIKYNSTRPITWSLGNDFSQSPKISLERGGGADLDITITAPSGTNVRVQKTQSLDPPVSWQPFALGSVDFNPLSGARKFKLGTGDQSGFVQANTDAVNPQATSIAPDSDSVAINQVDFWSPGSALNSGTAAVTIDYLKLSKQVGPWTGFLGVWTASDTPVTIVRLDLLSGAQVNDGKVTFFLDLGTEPGVNVESTQLKIFFSPQPPTGAPAGDSQTWPVGDTQYNGQGNEQPAPPGFVPPPPVGVHNWFYAIGGDVVDFNQGSRDLVEAAFMQCGAAAMADSLNWLREKYDIDVPHPHRSGLGDDGSLVGTLETYMGRTATDRRQGEGLTDEKQIEGKLEYLAKHNLGEVITVKHWTAIPPLQSDYTAHDLTSKYMGLPNPASLFEEIGRGEDVEITYVMPIPGMPGQFVGHVVNAMGAGAWGGRREGENYVGGVAFLSFGTDKDQNSDTAGVGVITTNLGDPDGDGLPNLLDVPGTPTIVTIVSESPRH